MSPASTRVDAIAVIFSETDGFFAYVAAMTQHELIPEEQTGGEVLPLFTF